MNEPVLSRPRPDWMVRGEAMPWSEAVKRLEAEENYWVGTVTTRGRPSMRPVWGVWMDGRLHLSVGHAGLQRAAQRRDGNTEVSVHVDSARAVTIIEGVARRQTDSAERRRAVALYNAKYDWDFDPESENTLNFVLVPRVGFGWTIGAKGQIENSAKWTFSSG